MHAILVVGGTRRDNHNDNSWIIESLGRLTEKLLESKLRSRSFSYIIKKSTWHRQSRVLEDVAGKTIHIPLLQHQSTKLQ